MTTWEEPKLFDIPPDRRIRPRGHATVILRAEIEVEIDLDDLEMIERYGRDVDPALPANWSTDESYLRWAIGNAAWCIAEEGHSFEIVAVADVEDLRLPDPFLSMSELCDEIAGPTWEPIEGAS
jgi:hypothetical protein